jgi:hypothetical protein
MNREIKFRVWDNVDYMSSPFTLSDLQSRRIEYVEGLPIMQFTGLTDKKGVEGYHKDIVTSGEKLFTIEWQEEEARFLLLPAGNNTGYWRFMDMLNSMEIIGNIYENPELLNQK